MCSKMLLDIWTRISVKKIMVLGTFMWSTTALTICCKSCFALRRNSVTWECQAKLFCEIIIWKYCFMLFGATMITLNLASWSLVVISAKKGKKFLKCWPLLVSEKIPLSWKILPTHHVCIFQLSGNVLSIYLPWVKRCVSIVNFLIIYINVLIGQSFFRHKIILRNLAFKHWIIKFGRLHKL